MNKPNNLKFLIKLDKPNCDDLLKIFDNEYTKKDDILYDRPTVFHKVNTNFIVNEFNLKNKEKFSQFLNLSKNLLELLELNYGPGKIWNLQISKMQGGGVIYPHVDTGLLFTFSHRIHIPLVTNKNVIFKVDNIEFYLKKGCVYELNNLKEHSVYNKNDSNHNRIHLILDYMSNEYISFVKPIFIETKKKKINFEYL